MLPQHPKLLACRQRLQAAETALRSEIDTALAMSKAEYSDVIGTEKNLLSDLNETKVEAMAAIDFEPEFLKLKRAHEYNLKLYEIALRSLKESGLSGSTRLNNVSVLDSALAPTGPSKPNVRMLLLIGALIGLLLGLGLGVWPRGPRQHGHEPGSHRRTLGSDVPRHPSQHQREGSAAARPHRRRSAEVCSC